MRGGVHSFFAEFAMGGERGGYPVVYKEIAPDKPFVAVRYAISFSKLEKRWGFGFK